MVVGTAGHVDHGKTRLIEALTGIDCDRWSEEKERGITIDLGFAHLQEEDLQLGFVDVPGHQRFLHNALAGLGGIRIVLLVVAADEGVEPQTLEHLQICSLLGIPHALVALSKCDLVAGELQELAQLEVEELLESTPFAGAPVMPVSSVTGEGVPELRQALLELARRVELPEEESAELSEAGASHLFRLPIDRAFQLRGLGAVVTGTPVSGRVTPGDALEILPAGGSAKVRSIQVHGEERESAGVGERTALQLAGVELAELERGRELATPGTLAATTSLCARCRLLPEAPEAIRGFVPVLLHLYASEVVGKLRPLEGPLEPGEEGLVEIRLGRPVVAVRGDRFIVRRPSPPLTLGGGRILDPRWRRRRGKSLAKALEALEERPRSLELWVAETGERGAAAEELAPRLGEPASNVAAELGELSSEGKLLVAETGRGRRWLAPRAFERVRERASRALTGYFRSDRLARGMPKAQLVEQTLPRRAADLGTVYLTWLEAAKVLVVEGDLVNLPGRKAQLSGEESQLSKDLLAAVEKGGLTPPSPPQLAAELGAKPQILEGVQRYLVERGKLVRLPSGLILSAAAVEELRRDLLGSGLEELTVAEFKDRYGLSRKWAIPLLEHLDSTGTTRRVGDRRQVVRRG